MEYVNRLLNSEKYIKLIRDLEQNEMERIYCKHDLSHLLDVARITYLLNIEYQLGLEKEMVYLTALLHDIGRITQYQDGEGHETTGAKISRQLLEEIHYPIDKQAWIIDHILNHRRVVMQDMPATQENVIALADKLSRNCYLCKAKDTCYWNEDKRTKEVRW